MGNNFLQVWQKLSNEERLEIFQETGKRKALPSSVIEKDWWVSLTLRIIFEMELAPHLLFKGGTSLSKAWQLIARFSEDIDLALNRSFLGFEGELSKSQVKLLRKKSYKYISKIFIEDLKTAFSDFGISDVNTKIEPAKSSDQDPLIVEIYYPNITEKIEYINPRVLVEIGSRSLSDPWTMRNISSMVSEEYYDKEFADPLFEIPCVNPERTFLEKIFLLHEEFQRPAEKMRVKGLSRHLYDIQKMMSTKFVDIAFSDKSLYETIVNHRKLFSSVGGVDYTLHKPETIQLNPPDTVMKDWKNDYEEMRENMIHEESLNFEDLMNEINRLQDRINSLIY